MKFVCPQCSQKIGYDVEHVGITIDCPACTTPVVVPPIARKLSKKKVTIVGIICLIAISGFGALRKPGHGPTIEFELKNEGNFFNKGEFLLKVQSSKRPELKFLIPVNIGTSTTGQNSGVARLPLPFPDQNNETLIFELLEDDNLTKKEKDKIVKLSGKAGYVIWEGIRIFALSRGAKLPPIGKPIEELVKSGTSAQIENLAKHRFDSYGIEKYPVSINPPKSHRDAAYLTIHHKDKVMMKLKVYYQ